MKRKYTIFLVFISLFISNVFAQISVNDIKKLNNSQLDLIREQLKSESPPISENFSPVDVPSTAIVNITASDNIDNIDNEYFGYNYFKRDINFFDNVPTPPDFRLGPGDEIILSLWGENNSRENFIINKEGLIYYENIGFISLANKTLEEAESVLIKELSRIYSTLKDKNNPTELMLELGQLRSLNVYFSGQIQNPGINLIHPFSDIFSAIVQAGGVQESGSLRKVQIIRSNKVIAVVDFYSFFTDGKDNFSNIRILEGDVVHIPELSIRARIDGAVVNEGYFELLEAESISDLIDYAGGLTGFASSYALVDLVIPIKDRSSDDNARSSQNVNIKEFSTINLSNGSSVNILSIPDVETKVRVIGNVKKPGEYAASSTLKTVLDLAGGFNDPIFRKTIRDNAITILRKDKNQFYGLEFQVSYTESNKFNLIPGDQIFVYEDSKYDNLFSITVSGQVKKRGTFQLRKGMTIGDAIKLAEGFTPLANEKGITITEVFTSVDNLGNEIEETTQVNDATLDFELTDGSVINILPLENVVSVEGNVYNPGLITYTGRQSIKKYIEMSGGLRKNSIMNDIYVERANGKIKRISRFNRIYTTAKPGDTIVVPIDENPSEFDITAFIADLAATLANVAAILIIVDNND